MLSINEKTCITFLILGLVIIMVCFPLYLGKIKRNIVYGFRIRKAFESDQNWYEINRYGAKSLIIWAVFLMAAGIMFLFIGPESVLTAAKISFISIIVPILLTIAYSKKLD
jgi:uncharacterized membrane protein